MYMCVRLYSSGVSGQGDGGPHRSHAGHNRVHTRTHFSIHTHREREREGETGERERERELERKRERERERERERARKRARARDACMSSHTDTARIHTFPLLERVEGKMVGVGLLGF